MGASPCKACEEWVCVCATKTQAADWSQQAQAASQQLYRHGLPLHYQPARERDQVNTQPAAPDPRLKGLTERLTRLLRHRATFLTYMRERQEDSDFHAVSDAANDLRELECEIRCVEEMIELVGGSVK